MLLFFFFFAVVQKHANELPQQNCLLVDLAETASWSALQVPESWEEGVREWRKSGKSTNL